MTRIVADVENMVQWKDDGVIDGSPFHPLNKLVSVGLCEIDDEDNIVNHEYLFFHHNEVDPVLVQGNYRIVQDMLDRCTLLIGHNLKHDLMWLFETGFRYDGKIWDTMLAEYILARGQKWPLNLDESCQRRMVAAKKSELVKQYWKDQIGYEAMPKDTVEEYGRADVQSAAELYLVQVQLYQQERNKCLLPTLDMVNQFCLVLTDMERNGICIDLEELTSIEEEYKKEQTALLERVELLIAQVMGDTPININSPEQLSMVVYGRKVIDKSRWAEVFNLGMEQRGAAMKPKRRTKMNNKQFADAIKRNTVRLRKTKASQCPECKGIGKVFKIKKDGTPWNKATKCKECGGAGLLYTDLSEWAGFGCLPIDVEEVASGGFSTDKITLSRLAEVCRVKGEKIAEEFLRAIIRLNAIDTYLNSFIGGIRRHVGYDQVLHCHFNQAVTATGRLSSSDPNFQNMPRGSTFPVKRAIKSRFEGGSIMEADYSTLEFSCAVHLANDPDGIAMVWAKEDAHKRTSKCLTEAGQPTDRQGSKSHTFKPLYGGMSGTEAEQAYYRAFINEFHPRIGVWHEELQNEAIRYKRIRLPTGREYAFPNAERTRWGTSTFATQIKNYPVQGFATGDIVPLANIRIWLAIRAAGIRSVMVNTVHDSIVIDVYPGEEAIVKKIVVEGMCGVVDELKKRYDIELLVPLRCEIKIGPNWLKGDVIYPEKEAA